jgi:transposase
MSLQPQPAYPIPDETRRVAYAAFPKGALCLRLVEVLGQFYLDDQFAALFPTRGQPAASPARLALVLVLQYVEGLSDRQAADAVRSRIDWKYALGLELTDPGFDHTVLSEFRARLLSKDADRLLLDTLLARLRQLGLIKQRGRQRTDSTYVLAAVRRLNRLERVGETLRAALNELAVVAPEWLRKLAPPQWYERYAKRVENYALPKSDAARQELASVIASDGEQLLDAIAAATDQPILAQLPAVLTLRRLWAEQYSGTAGKLRWREVKEMPSPAGLLSSPYDTEARYSTKRDVNWMGYKVHLTETCDEQQPHLIVNVETTPATTPDDNMLEQVHDSLKVRDLLPAEHLVDKGYTDAHVLVDSQRQHGVTIVGPVAEDPSWQARSGGFDKGSFIVDWERRVVTCPAGKQSISWLPNSYLQNGVVFEARFARKDCAACPDRARCTRSKLEPRTIGLQAREYHEALRTARQRQKTKEFRSQYAARAGIEGTHEQAIRRCGLRQCRYLGQAKTRLQHVLTATAINLVRLNDWWTARPHAKTRVSHFATLTQAA